MNILSKFLDWNGAAIKVLKWYEQIVTAFSGNGESFAETEQRLLSKYNSGSLSELSPSNPGDAYTSSEETAELLSIFFSAWQKLNETERCILREFYISKRSGTLELMIQLSISLGYERTRLYQLKKDALARFAFLLFRHI